MRNGFFITFEGLDGTGKTTQLRRLSAALQQQGRRVREMRQPGGTALGDRLRALLVEARGGAALDAKAELAMMFADRAQAIAEVIAPALAEGEIVLCDRWTDSTEAYQGGGRGLGEAVVRSLHAELCGGLEPDLTLLLLPPMEVSLARARGRNARHEEVTGRSESRFERETNEFFARTYAQYEAIARREPVRVVTIADDAPLDAVGARITAVVDERLRAFGQR